MGYFVRIEVGKGMNKTIMQSIILPNKERVAEYIKRNPAIRANTNVLVVNTLNKKRVIAKPYFFTSKFGKFQNS